MAESKFTTFKINDAEVFQAIRNVATDCGLPSAKCFLRLAKDHRELQVDLQSIEPTVASLLKENSVLIQQIRAHFDEWGATLKIDRTNGRADELIVQFPNEFNNDNVVKLLIAVRKHFRLFDAMENVARVLGPEIADFYAKREEGLHRLEQLTGKIIEQNEDYRKKLELQHEERIGKLEIQFNERRSLLEAELNKKNEEIATKEAELAQRNQELDDRSSRHARRQLRQDFKKGIESRNLDFRLTPYTRRTRIPIHLLFVVLVISFGIFSYESILAQIHPPEGANPLYLAIRVPIGILAFAASVIYYIRWNDQWFQKHANEEFRLKRLDLDIDRASWLVEMALEWKDEKGTEIPKDLVDRLSRNLFASRDDVIEEVKHPTQEALSRVLGTLSSLQVQIPGLGEATIGRRGINALRKAAKEEEKRNGET